MSNNNFITMKTKLGTIKGLENIKSSSFLGIPYATHKRFHPPEIIPGWSNTLDATSPGPVPPQLPSRLASVMGDFDIKYDENCLSLNIWTPGKKGDDKSVIMWIHGGAFVSGSGSLPWYDGQKFSENQDVVVVGINYRLGALGFLYHPDISPGNLGILDQIAALEWIQENIREFGGNPKDITVMGQSAGAISAYALLANSKAQKMFHKVILQSGRYEHFETAASSEEKSISLSKIAGVDIEKLTDLEIEKILEAQTTQAIQSATFASTSIPYLPIVDGITVPKNVEEEALRGAKDKHILIGYTQNEMHAFLSGRKDIENASISQIEGVFKRDYDDDWKEKLEECYRRLPSGTPMEILSLGLNNTNFAGNTNSFTQKLSERGIPTWLYRFDWGGPESPFGACHCIELPFVFGNFDKWLPPMLAGGDVAEMKALSQVVQKAWGSFAQHGTPNDKTLIEWPAYENDRKLKLIWNRYIEVTGS